MAQKDKIKELVGRGLNSYHTKALQQMDRIEKKNKEQNHKISILSNELDNDYLTKTEEGSVISLEHSKEGMVYLDELQGNTLVNYCTDGSKEMTLNGDIDVEGTFVTTTEGVDNGKVDVICEGNTLVNKLYKIKNYGSITEFLNHGWNSGVANCNRYEWLDNGIKIYSTLEDISTDRYYRSTPEKYGIFKKNRTYIVRMNVNSDNFEINATILRCFYGNGRVFMAGTLSEVKNGVFVKKATTSSEIEECDAIHSMISLDYIRPLNTEGWVSFQNVMVIDVTDLPSYQQDVEYWRNIEYFEGMKSVGQDDENGHKIEILSSDDTSDLEVGNFYTGTQYVYPNMDIKDDLRLRTKPIEIDETKTYNMKVSSDYTFFTIFLDNEKRNISQALGHTSERTNIVPPTGAKYIRFAFKKKEESIITKKDYFNMKVVTNVPFKLNKKEILLNEPLRGLPNGVKDKKVKIGNKWYIERNCGEIILDGSEEDWVSIHAFSKTNVFRKPLLVAKNKITDYETVVNNFLVDKLPIVKYSTYDTTDAQTVSFSSLFNSTYNGTAIYINRNSSSDLVSFKQWLSENPITVIYELATPIYEPLEVEPTLNTYNDITHISNNSIIPCNMKIKNSGYNAIIKPSTLYTVALDTNKSGTIGMNLGGTKGTTTNNVLKLTTPATLADDSLRIYGKGIKGSKVRLLEGDKTNWIPSFFEGMKSSFEDKFDATDNTYKMEILSNNKNLINIKDYNKNTWGINISYSQGQIVLNGTLTGKDDGLSDYYLVGGWDTEGDNLNLKPNTRYTFSGNIPNGVEVYIIHKAKVLCGINSGNKIATWTNGSIRDVNALMVRVREGHTFSNTKVNIQIEEGSTSTTFVNNIYNKIQFSSIEPLRSVSDIKDRFVFKDNKLMIERNCITKDLTRSMSWSLNATGVSTNHTQFVCRILPTWNCSGKEEQIICTKKPTKYVNSGNNSIWIYDKTTIVVQMRYDLIKTKEEFLLWIDKEQPKIVLPLAEPTYEEIPFELQKIILEGYENSTLFFDTNIPPTSTITYAGETPIVKSVKLNKTEVLNNTNDINDNIIPYLMDMDYRVVCLQLATEEIEGGASVARLFGGAYEMLKRDILSKRLTREEYGHRLADYFNAGKLTEEQVRELEDLR